MDDPAPYTLRRDPQPRSHHVRDAFFLSLLMISDKCITVYIYRTVLDSINGVSSTRATSIAAFTLQEGEIRQLQFIEDDTLIILWSDSSTYHRPLSVPNDSVTDPMAEGSSYLLNVPFQPASAHPPSEKTDSLPLVSGYINYGPRPTSPTPTVQARPLDLQSLLELGAVRHVFAESGPKARPIRLDVNGRKDRRAVCVLYGDGMRYDVLDLDAAMENEEDEENEEVEG